MEKLKLLVTCALVLVVGAAPVALGDWNPGDPYKMHYPQEPDPFGWDVCICCQAVADDFNCVAGGPIEDIHFWISWLYDELGVVGSWYIAIWDDVGSLPGSELWRWNGVGNLRIRHYGTGNQGWVCPYEPAWIVPDDHFNFYQVNITDINEPFVQTADTVYWLVIMADPLEGVVGWKTSTNFPPGPIWGKPAMFSDDGGATWSPVDTGIAASEQHDMAFVITSGEGVDWGDAPDYWPMGGGYPTLAGNNGANHGIRGPWLGDTTDAPDAEPDGQPDATATGDDLDADGDDEDGVSIPVLVQGQTDNITFEVNGGGGHVNIWINWNNDMDWDDPGEKVEDKWYGDGIYSIPVTPPLTSVVGQTFLRARISLDGSLPPGGPASDGEVEDHEVWIEEAPPERDFGDAPDPTYPTFEINDGARHVLGSTVFLGNGVDGEPDGQPEPAALGDDMNIFYPGIPWPPGDEDGVVFTSPLIPGSWASVDVTVSAAGYLNAWLDFGGDGSWAEATDQIFLDEWLDPTINPNPQTLSFWVPFGAKPGPTFARFRFSTQRLLSYVGQATDGEVEDYQIDIEENPRIKWIQRPDTSPNGIDIKVDEQRWLADDFECKSYGPITDVHLWGSWKYDQVGEITRVHLSIHSDDPVGPGGTDPNNTYSKPDRLQWEHDFWAGQFEMIPVAYVPDGEYWWDPLEPGSLLPSGDWTIWRIDVYIDPCDAFIQDGDPCNPVIYWLDVQVDTYMGEFGWKTRRFPEQFMDDAVWDYGSELPRVWKELRYPKGHPYEGKSIDMAFVLTGEEWPRPKEPVPHLKWSQPPIEIDPTAITPTFCGWDEPSFATDPATLWKLVADDFRCLGNMPVTSIHWWGSYFRWEGPEPPEPQPIAWRVGFWSNVPANPDVDPNFSYPEKLLWQIELPVDRVAWEAVGDDFHPWFPYYDTCFQYYVKLEPEEYFRQGDYELNTRDNVFWISIAAIYPPEFIIQFPWGWKTRPWSWMDDAVWFEVNEDPYPGMPTVPSRITPIVDPYTRESSDVAFELDTDPNWIKWEQPFTGIRHWRHYEDVESMGYEDASGALNIVRAAADDWPCKRLTPVTAMVWWGSYIGYRYEACGPQMMAPPVKPDYFLLRIYDDVPAGVDTTYSHPNNVIWQYRAFDYDEVMVGYDKYPRDVIGPPREPVFRYSVRLPQSVWFRQKKVESIYWLSVTAVYKAGNDPTYHWGWTNHEYTAKDWAVYGFWDYSGPVPVWVWRPVWSDQAQAYVDLSFMLFTEPGCFPCAYSTYWDWLAYGKPGCWCALPEGSGYQCVGDADQATSGFPYNYRVFTGDLNWLITCWKMKMGDAGLNPCADMDHKSSGFPYNYRVFTGDLNILIMYWKKKDVDLGIPGPCPMPE